MHEDVPPGALVHRRAPWSLEPVGQALQHRGVQLPVPCPLKGGKLSENCVNAAGWMCEVHHTQAAEYVPPFA